MPEPTNQKKPEKHTVIITAGTPNSAKTLSYHFLLERLFYLMQSKDKKQEYSNLGFPEGLSLNEIKQIKKIRYDIIKSRIGVQTGWFSNSVEPTTVSYYTISLGNNKNNLIYHLAEIGGDFSIKRIPEVLSVLDFEKTNPPQGITSLLAELKQENNSSLYGLLLDAVRGNDENKITALTRLFKKRAKNTSNKPLLQAFNNYIKNKEKNPKFSSLLKSWGEGIALLSSIEAVVPEDSKIITEFNISPLESLLSIREKTNSAKRVKNCLDNLTYLSKFSKRFENSINQVNITKEDLLYNLFIDPSTIGLSDVEREVYFALKNSNPNNIVKIINKLSGTPVSLPKNSKKPTETSYWSKENDAQDKAKKCLNLIDSEGNYSLNNLSKEKIDFTNNIYLLTKILENTIQETDMAHFGKNPLTKKRQPIREIKFLAENEGENEYNLRIWNMPVRMDYVYNIIRNLTDNFEAIKTKINEAVPNNSLTEGKYNEYVKDILSRFGMEGILERLEKNFPSIKTDAYNQKDNFSHLLQDGILTDNWGGLLKITRTLTGELKPERDLSYGQKLYNLFEDGFLDFLSASASAEQLLTLYHLKRIDESTVIQANSALLPTKKENEPLLRSDIVKQKLEFILQNA